MTSSDPQSESLLRRLLNDTLDPGYQDAAQRRSDRAAEQPRAGTGMPGRLLLAGSLLLIGCVTAIVVTQVRSSAPQREELRQALIQDIAQERADGDVLQERLAEVREAATGAREELLAATTQGQNALNELNRAESGAGLTAVRGPGLAVTLTDAPAPEDGGENLGRILDRDVQSVVNELWGAGAEAVAIDGQRLGPTTSIRSAGEAILVDFRPVTNPYAIEAIGPQDMFDQLLESAAGRTLASYAAAFGLGLDVVQVESVELLPGAGAVVTVAQPARLQNNRGERGP